MCQNLYFEGCFSNIFPALLNKRCQQPFLTAQSCHSAFRCHSKCPMSFCFSLPFMVLLTPPSSFSYHFILMATAFNLLTDFFTPIARARASMPPLSNTHGVARTLTSVLVSCCGGSTNSRVTRPTLK